MQREPVRREPETEVDQGGQGGGQQLSHANAGIQTLGDNLKKP